MNDELFALRQFLIKEARRRAAAEERLIGLSDRAIELVQTLIERSDPRPPLRPPCPPALGPDAMLATVVEALPNGTLVEDDRGTVLAVNAEFCHLLEIYKSPASLVGTSFVELPAQAGAHSGKASAFLAKMEEIRQRRGRVDGAPLVLPEKVLELHYLPILMGERAVGHLWQLRDVTTRSAEDEALREKNRAAEATSNAKSQFLGMMSHEMRTPLSAILGMTELLSRTALTAEQDRYIARLLANSQHLLGLVEDVLDHARLEAKSVSLRERDTSLRALLENVSEQFAQFAQNKGVELVLDVHRSIPMHVTADEQRLRQILVNLVSNAVKYTPSGSVVISASAVALDGGAYRVKYAVTDTGLGIDSAHVARVFERFYRVENSSTSSIRGTGLGLSICQQLAVLMGSEIRVESRPGQGSTFWFEVVHNAAKRRSLPGLSLAKLRAVVFDPSDVAGAAMVALIEGWGGSAVHVGGLSEARTFAFEPNLVFVDVRLLSGDLDNLGRLYEAFPELSSCPVVFLCTNPSQEVPAGAQVLFKPVRALRLFECASGILDGEVHDPSRTPPRHPPSMAAHRYRVLLAEDDLDNRHLIKRILEHNGFLVTEAYDGSIALEMLRAGHYHLLVTDLNMPFLDGFELVAGARELERTQNAPRLPIVVMSAFPSDENRARCEALGISGFFEKPVLAGRLVKTVHEILGNLKTVLVVDDSTDVRELVRAHLGTRSDFEILEAADAKSAYALLTPELRLVFVDGQLPDESGVNVVGKIRRALPSVKIVAMTGDEFAKASMLRAGCDAFLLKPVTRRQLLDEITRLLDEVPEVDSGAGEVPPSSPAAPSSSRATVDRTQWNPDIADLIPGYLGNLGRHLRRMRVLVEEGQFQDVARIGHDLKGSGGAYGFEEVTELGAAIERDGYNADRVALVVSLDALHNFLLPFPEAQGD